MAGTPAMFAGTVKMSTAYIATGSDFSPNLKAGAGVVGVTIASTFINASENSARMTSWTARALR